MTGSSAKRMMAERNIRGHRNASGVKLPTGVSAFLMKTNAIDHDANTQKMTGSVYHDFFNVRSPVKDAS